jgi:thymidylate kinase
VSVIRLPNHHATPPRASQLTERNGIEAQLAQGIDVIADRYAFSGIAFSAGKVSRRLDVGRLQVHD